jgi:hypothetical protein
MGVMGAMEDRLDRSELLAAASEQTGLTDFGDIPFHEPLDVLLGSLEREAGLDDAGWAGARATIVGLLVKRLRLVDDRKRHPTIADEIVKAPVFIVGPPRTGSTHLHALMAQVEGVRAPMFWEMTLPSPPPEAATSTTDPRIAQVQAAVDQLPAEMLIRHPIAPMRPEQCNLITDWSLINQALLAYYEIPTYRDWVFNADHSPAYEAHRRTLQHLQWRNPGQWVLKYPKHLLNLDTLLAFYPDARFVWTHRDPAVVLPSCVSFTGYIRSQATPGYDPVRFGPEWMIFEEIVLARGIATRDRLVNEPARNYDLYYGDLMADPIGSLDAVFDHFDLPFTEVSARRVQAWLDDHPQTKHGVHQYKAEDFGLTTAGLRRRFAFYTDRFDVPPDPKADG